MKNKLTKTQQKLIDLLKTGPKFPSEIPFYYSHVSRAFINLKAQNYPIQRFSFRGKTIYYLLSDKIPAFHKLLNKVGKVHLKWQQIGRPMLGNLLKRIEEKYLIAGEKPL